MDWEYVFYKCLSNSYKGMAQLKKLKSIDDCCDFSECLKEIKIENNNPSKKSMGKYSELKEAILKQILPICICSEYYETESNNKLSELYFSKALKAVDKVLCFSKKELEAVLSENQCTYNSILASALAIRYGLDKGFLQSSIE